MAIDKECGVLSYLKPQNEGIRKIVTRQSSTGQQLSLRQPLVGHDENVTGTSIPSTLFGGANPDFVCFVMVVKLPGHVMSG